MSRRMARVTHDEITRMVKAVQDRGLSIGRVEYDGDLNRLAVVISGDSGEKPAEVYGHDPKVVPLLREPKL